VRPSPDKTINWNNPPIKLSTERAHDVVDCRCEAWHWRPQKDIMHSVGNEHLRPKIPPGLDETCAHWVRRCLHADPGQRPTAKELTEWLMARRKELNKQMQSQKKRTISEAQQLREEKKEKEEGEEEERETFCITINEIHLSDWEETALQEASPEDIDAENISPRGGAYRCAITHYDEHDSARCWNHGQYSPHYITHEGEEPLPAAPQPEAVPAALQSADATILAEPEPEPEPELQREAACRVGKLKDRKLGIVFNLKASQAKEAGFEETEREQWPSIARIVPLDQGKTTLASGFPDLRVGCRLTKIGDKEIAEKGTKFAQFKKDFQTRPLRLTFLVPDGQEKLFEPWPTAQWPVSKERASSVPEWVKAGLDEVKKVAKHEKAEQKKAETPALQEQLARAQDEISVLKQQLEEARAQARAATVAAAAGGARSGDSGR
jgi:hypothetical protein